MEIYSGVALNISQAIVGRVTKSTHAHFRLPGRILVAEAAPNNVAQYAAVITSVDELNEKLKHFAVAAIGLDTSALSNFEEGDVLLLTPEGRASVVWKTNSPHNQLFVTDRCNALCIMCPQVSEGAKRDYGELNEKILSLAEPGAVERIGITGGEPTLALDDLVRVLDHCKKKFPQAWVSLLTNGKRCSNFEVVKRLVEVGYPRLTFCVPIYADNDLEHDKIVGSAGSFSQTVLGLHNLARFRQFVEIRVVVLRQNAARLQDLAEFIYRNLTFSVHVAFMGMECTGLADENHDLVWIDPVDYMPELERAVYHLHQRAMNVSIYNLPLCLLPRRIWPFSRDSISQWKKAYLPQCKECEVQERCGGVFSTSTRQSLNIRPVIESTKAGEQ